MKVDFSKSFSPKRVITFFLLLIFLVFSYHFIRQVYLSLKTAENTAKIEIEVFSDDHEALNEVSFYTSSPRSAKNKMIKTGAKFFRERGYVHTVFFNLPDGDRLQFIKIKIQMGDFVSYISNQEVTFLKGFYFIPLPRLNQTKLPFSFLKSTVNWKGDYFLLYDSFKIACIKSIKLIFPLIVWLSLLVLLITLGSFLATFRLFSTGCASSPYGHFLSLGLLTLSSVFLVVFFLYHYAVITDTHQVELREGAIVSTTDALLKGVNPYDYQNQPELTNVYGVLYSFLVSPFARVLGPTLIIHRIISAVFIFLVLAILFIYLRHQQVELSLILGGICLIYGSLLYMAPPCAKPDSLALFLFLCSLLIPSLLKNSPLALTISGLCLVLVFFSKMHYILGIPALSFYLFLFDSKIKGMAYFVATSFGLLASGYFISIVFPTYLDNSFFNHINISGDELSWALKQFYYFSFYNFSLIIILILYVSLLGHEYYGRLTAGIHYGQLTKREIKKYFNISDLNRPFLPFHFCRLLLLFGRAFHSPANIQAWKAYRNFLGLLFLFADPLFGYFSLTETDQKGSFKNSFPTFTYDQYSGILFFGFAPSAFGRRTRGLRESRQLEQSGSYRTNPCRGL